MTRRISKSGRAYTVGSQATFDGYPRVCAAGERCVHGGKVVMSGPFALWFEHVDGADWSWHFDCRPRVRALR